MVGLSMPRTKQAQSYQQDGHGKKPPERETTLQGEQHEDVLLFEVEAGHSTTRRQIQHPRSLKGMRGWTVPRA